LLNCEKKKKCSVKINITKLHSVKSTTRKYDTFRSHITAFIQGAADFNSAANYDRRATRSHIAFDNLVTRRGTTAGGVDEEAKPKPE
jgi:hypothetical protein